MKILHIVPGTSDISNGMVVVARLIAKEQGDASVLDLNSGLKEVARPAVEEVWVHGMWLPKEWAVCWNVLKSGKRLVRMTHGSLSPIYLRCQSPLKKFLVSPIERYLLRKASKVIATCQAESDWIRSYLGHRCPPILLTDLKRFFNLDKRSDLLSNLDSRSDLLSKLDFRSDLKSHLHLLYLGRRHPLKGLSYLEAAVRQLSSVPSSLFPVPPQLKVVSNAFGEELEKVWDWCDVLVLPTLSDNFGLVIAEALERGKRVITTDGAPAWSPSASAAEDKGDGNDYGGRLVYLRGYREGSPEDRVRLLIDAITSLANA